jgi:SAM-dependent methyltransferase
VIGADELLAAVDGAATVLDVGCGSGRLTAELARRGAEVTGTDVNEARMAAAAERAEAEGLPVRIVAADMNQPLPFPDAEFAAAVSRLSLMIARDPAATLREVGRTVAPGGVVATAVWARIEENPWFGEPRSAVAEVLGAEAAQFARVFGRLGEADEVVAVHRDAGLAGATAVTLRDEVPAASAADHWRELAATIGHYRRLNEALDPHQQAALVDALDRRLEPYRRDGALRIPRAMVVAVARAV